MIARVLALLCITASAFAQTPQFVITGFDEPFRLTGVSAVLKQGGDFPEYRRVDFADSNWKIVSLPDSYDNYYTVPQLSACWYRLHIRFPNDLPNHALGLYLGKVLDTDRVYFNGALIGMNGVLNTTNLRSASDVVRIYEIPARLIRPGADNVLSIRVEAAYQAGGLISTDITIGPYVDMFKSGIRREMLKGIFIIVYLVISAYFFVFYFRRTTDKEHLYFALFTFFIALYFLLLTQLKYYISVDYDLMKRLEYMTLFPLPAFFLKFILEFYHTEAGTLQKFYFITAIVSTLAVLVVDNPVFWHHLNINFVQITWLIPFATVFYILIRHIGGKDARFMLVSFTIMFLFVFLDVIISRNSYLVANYGYFSTYGFLFFIASMALILANRFVTLHNSIRNLNESLKENIEFIQIQNVQLKELDKMKGDLISNVSHELRTPITTVYGGLEILYSGDVNLKDTEISKVFVETIFQGVVQLKKIINNFIFVSLQEKALPYLQEFSLAKLIEEAGEKYVAKEWKSLVEKKGLRYLPRNLQNNAKQFIIKTDREFFLSLLYEILHNAILYNRDKGEAELSIIEAPKTLTLCVSDTGIGIPEDEKGRIFERFFRASNVRTESLPGLGLGLAVVRMICDKLGYGVGFESKEGEGTRIFITIPDAHYRIVY